MLDLNSDQTKTISNKKSQQLKRKIQKLKETLIERYLSELTVDRKTNYSLWRATRKIKRPIVQNLPVRNHNESWVREDRQKAEVSVDHLAKIFQPHDGSQHVMAMSNNLYIADVNIELVSPGEVARDIHTNLNPKKVPEYGLIMGEVLKQLPRKGIVMLTYLWNATFRFRHFPRQRYPARSVGLKRAKSNDPARRDINIVV